MQWCTMGVIDAADAWQTHGHWGEFKLNTGTNEYIHIHSADYTLGIKRMLLKAKHTLTQPIHAPIYFSYTPCCKGKGKNSNAV